MTEQVLPAPAPPPLPPAPPFGGLTKIVREGWEGVPDGASPFYVGARDGLFVHKRMLIGRGMARVDTFPATFPKFGSTTGGFQFEADPIPAILMGQIVNFFERIYDRQHTEAAVLLVMHADTKQWRVFIPTQLVSHGGVNYVFDPSHIKWPWVLVGSIHSHCDFGAGHSSTDTGDADGFDGLHCTIGHIKNPIPEIVAMVAMNKKLFHYGADLFDRLFNYSETKQHEAPAWWDRYVENTQTKTKPVGFELYKKFDRPTIIKQESKTTVTRLPASPGYQGTGYVAKDWVWNENAKRMIHTSWTVDPDGTVHYGSNVGKGQSGLRVVNHVPSENRMRTPNTDTNWDEFDGADSGPSDSWSIATLLERGYSWDSNLRTWRWTGGGASHILTESEQFNARREAERGVDWKKFEDEGLRGLLRDQGDVKWEDEIDATLLEALYDSQCLTEEDVESALRNPEVASDPLFWRDTFMLKAMGIIRVIEATGMEINITVPQPKPEQNQIALLPETTMHHGAH